MLALARVGMEGQLSISDIAEKEGLSVPYASKLLAILRKAKLATAVRGRGGGFCIARPAAEINLLEVMTALGGPLLDPDHCEKFTGQLDECVHKDECSVHHVLDSLSAFIGDILERTTMEDLVKRAEAGGIRRKTFITADSLLHDGENFPFAPNQPDDTDDDVNDSDYKPASM